MYYLNKIALYVANPVVLAIFLWAAGYALRRRWLYAVSAAWLYLWCTALPLRWIGVGLEDDYPVKPAAEYPQADAIVLLGGGISSNPDAMPVPDLSDAADRAWFAAGLYRAGKAPVVIPTGTGSSLQEAPFLADLGVPAEAIAIDDDARNTEENATMVRKILDSRGGGRKVLLVTSAWHMRRSLLMFSKYAPDLEIVPAPSDWTCTCHGGGPFRAEMLLPGAENLSRNLVIYKELLGYAGYKLFR